MKLRFKVLLMLTLPATCCYAQKAEDTLQLHDLTEVLQLAVKQNPTVTIYQRQVTQAHENYKASQAFLMPSVSAGFNGTDNLSIAVTPVPGEIFGQPGTTIYAKFGKNYVYNTGLTVNQTLFDWTNVMQAKIAASNIQLSRLQQDAYIQTLKEQVARFYFSALIAKNALAINERDERLGDSVLALAKQKLKEGSSDLIAVNQAGINLNAIVQNKGQSQQLYDQSIENLKILIGAKASTDLTIEETLNTEALLADGNTTMGADRSLSVYKQQAQIATEQTLSARAAAYPKIGATAFFGDQQFRNDFGLSFSEGAWRAYNYIGLSINIPLFTGLGNLYRYKSARTQQDIASKQYDNAVQQSAINDRLVLKNYADYLTMAKASAASFKLYGNNLKLNGQKYAEGVIGIDIYQKALQDYLGAENAYLNNLSLLLSTQSTLISRQ